MKIVTALNGKKTIKISKEEWKTIGKRAGWKIAQVVPEEYPGEIGDVWQLAYDYTFAYFLGNSDEATANEKRMYALIRKLEASGHKDLCEEAKNAGIQAAKDDSRSI